MKGHLFLIGLTVLSLTACKNDADIAVPAPITMTAEATGYYCQMNLAEHEGPKAQIHVAGREMPLWFSQVRDAIAFMRLPEETAEVRAAYVNDMGKATSWSEPGVDNWIDARRAIFVIESRQTGGMGAPEAVPFSDRAEAAKYVAEFGGRVVAWDEIPDSYVLAPVNLSSASPMGDEVKQ